MKAFLLHPAVVALWLIIGMCVALYNRKTEEKPVPVFDWAVLVVLGPCALFVIIADAAMDKLNSIKI